MTPNQPRLQVTSVTIGAADPQALAEFYARLLGAEVAASEGDWAQLRQEDPRITLNFEAEPGHVPPTWPTMDGQQQTQEHLDIYVEDLEAATDWAVLCGARLAMHQPQERVRVLFDPQGHPFCLFAD